MRGCTYKIVVVGTSLGGLHALETLLRGFPQQFPLPIVIVQHRHKDSDDTLSSFLQQQCLMPLKEVEDKDLIRPGHVYLAPADYHVLVGLEHFVLSVDAPVCHARPSINVLFESAAEIYREGVIAVILTGSSNDGTQGVLSIQAHGGFVVVQEPATAESPIMPASALDALQQHSPVRGVTEQVLPLPEIAPFLVKLCHAAWR